MRPVVLVHGLIGPFADPRTVARLRPAGVLSPHLIGYGRGTDIPAEGITVEAQAEALLSSIDQAGVETPLNLVGHSVGWVIVAHFARAHPDRVASLVNVEGNFTLADAFWSRQIAKMTPAAFRDILETDRADPARWLTAAGIEPTPGRVRLAAEALGYQPASTVQAMARAVVEYTARPGYERHLREVFEAVPVHLVAGARSRTGWNVPHWALSTSASSTDVPGVGHMVMLEAPEEFGTMLRDIIEPNETIAPPQPTV